MTATEKQKSLLVRHERLKHHRMGMFPTDVRYRALTHAMSRLWTEIWELDIPVWHEKVLEEWPLGLPAHP